MKNTFEQNAEELRTKLDGMYPEGNTRLEEGFIKCDADLIAGSQCQRITILNHLYGNGLELRPGDKAITISIRPAAQPK